MGLRCHSANEILGGTDKFMFPKFHLYRAVSDVLEEEDRVTEATKRGDGQFHPGSDPGRNVVE